MIHRHAYEALDRSVRNIMKNIDASQGQTLEYVGLWPSEPLFTHGQLFVALSRVSSRKNIKISIPHKNATRNIVFKNVLI